jgi:hypothetical protein
LLDQAGGTIDILHGNGDGTFQAVQAYTFPGFAATLQVADFNADGRLDIAVSGGQNDVWVLLGTNFNLTPAATYPIPSDSSFSDLLLVDDFNGDGAIDIAANSENIDREQLYLTVLLNLGGTRVGLTSSQNPSKVGQAVTFTAPVNASVPTVPIPTPSGSVSFLDGRTVLGTVPIVSGQAQFTTSTLSAGTHSIHALYNGDKNYVRTLSATLKQVVQQ